MSRPPKTITFNGEKLTVAEWAARLGISVQALRYRFKHWPLTTALTVPRDNAAHADGIRAERQRLQREFSKLVYTLNGALEVFKYQLDTPGVGHKPRKVAADRSFPSSQDTV